MQHDQVAERIFDADENRRRVQAGLAGLISGHAVEFSKSNAELIVVFNVAPSVLAEGRIVLFQQTVEQWTGTAPEIVKQVSACVKVFFSYPLADHLRSDARRLFRSEPFLNMYKALAISQVQIFGEIVTPPPV